MKALWSEKSCPASVDEWSRLEGKNGEHFVNAPDGRRAFLRNWRWIYLWNSGGHSAVLLHVFTTAFWRPTNFICDGKPGNCSLSLYCQHPVPVPRLLEVTNADFLRLQARKKQDQFQEVIIETRKVLPNTSRICLCLEVPHLSNAFKAWKTAVILVFQPDAKAVCNRRESHDLLGPAQQAQCIFYVLQASETSNIHPRTWLC